MFLLRLSVCFCLCLAGTYGHLTIPDQYTDLCLQFDNYFDECLAHGYQPQWIKCAHRIFQLQHVVDRAPDVDELVEYLELTFPGQRYIHQDENGEYRFTDGNHLTLNEVSSCRYAERRMKRVCSKHSKFTCLKMYAELRARRRGEEPTEGEGEVENDAHSGHVMAGADDPMVQSVKVYLLYDFVRRAMVKHGPTITLVEGTLVDVYETMAAGDVYELTMMVGFTTDAECYKNSQANIVQYTLCNHAKLSKVKLSTLYQLWMAIPYTGVELEDIDGTPLKPEYWDVAGDGYTQLNPLDMLLVDGIHSMDGGYFMLGDGHSGHGDGHSGHGDEVTSSSYDGVWSSDGYLDSSGGDIPWVDSAFKPGYTAGPPGYETAPPPGSGYYGGSRYYPGSGYYPYYGDQSEPESNTYEESKTEKPLLGNMLGDTYEESKTEKPLLGNMLGNTYEESKTEKPLLGNMFGGRRK